MLIISSSNYHYQNSLMSYYILTSVKTLLTEIKVFVGFSNTDHIQSKIQNMTSSDQTI